MGTQLLVGVLLVLDRFVPLALALIAPVLVNIIALPTEPNRPNSLKSGTLC